MQHTTKYGVRLDQSAASVGACGPMLWEAWALDHSKMTVESDASLRCQLNTHLVQVGLSEFECALFLQAAADMRCKVVEDAAERMHREHAASAG